MTTDVRPAASAHAAAAEERRARVMRVDGVVQGVGFRPFVARLAGEYRLGGWVLNDGHGVVMHVEGMAAALDAFEGALRVRAPRSASIERVTARDAPCVGAERFEIRRSAASENTNVTVAADLSICDECLAEVRDAASRRHAHAYASCSSCGPRWSIVTALPYDRVATTMADWAMCASCAAEYADPSDRRFHMQAVACGRCGPAYAFVATDGDAAEPRARVGGPAAIVAAADALRAGRIVAVKGVGGYHLACDALNVDTVRALRARKFRKERPFAIMVRDVGAARRLVALTPDAEALLASPARPIVLAPSRIVLAEVAPDQASLGVMLPYTALHHLLFDAGAPEHLVMTSGNRSSEPIAFEDADALDRLHGLADAFLIGERRIARRVEDSVVRAGPAGSVIVRRSRGFAPAPAARLPDVAPILALGADLKNTITLVVNGRAVVSPHVGDLDDLSARTAFADTIRDLVSMHGVAADQVTIAHDAHPDYVSRAFADQLPARSRVSVQHHRAHVASVLAERGELTRRVIGVAFDGTGYGDDGAIWGGEFFAGSVAGGFQRVGHLRETLLPGGDAAARHPVQAAAGVLSLLDDLPDLESTPFFFPPRYRQAVQLVRSRVRTFRTTSAGRLFDAVAALLGFTRGVTFEGQAAMWLESIATHAAAAHLPGPEWRNGQLDVVELLSAVIAARQKGCDIAELSRGFHAALATGIVRTVRTLGEEFGTRVAALSGGVFQNQILLADVSQQLEASGFAVWINRIVPPNDGGVSLGQAAIAASLAGR
jgi:hydrogenase maturation protein HypF